MYPEHLSNDPAPESAHNHDHQPRRDEKISFRERASLSWYRLVTRVNVGVMVAYSGAVALIGIEGLAVVLSFSSLWPVGIPIIVGMLAFVYFFRERLLDLWHRLRGTERHESESPTADETPGQNR